MPVSVLTQAQVDKIYARRLRLAMFVLLYTGQLYPVPHPLQRAQKHHWSSTASRTTLPSFHFTHP